MEFLNNINNGDLTVKDARAVRRPARTGAVSYIGGMLEYLHDKLTSTFGSPYTNLSQDYQERLILIGYNHGWDGVNGLNNLIQSLGYGKVLTRYKNYPNKTLDQYNRWRSQIK